MQLLVAAEILGLNLGKRLADIRQPGEVVSVTAASETIGNSLQNFSNLLLTLKT